MRRTNSFSAIRCVVFVDCAVEASTARAAGMRCVGVHEDVDKYNIIPPESRAFGLEAVSDVVFASLGDESEDDAVL